MPGMDPNWKSGEQWAKEHAGPPAGLPKKHIHVDSDVQLPASQQTQGQLYGDDLKKVVEDQLHPIRCPKCGAHVYAINSGGATYQIRVSNGNGKSHMESVPDCPIELGLGTPMTVALNPCNCGVSMEWASALTGEINRRLQGYIPQTVKVFDNKEWRAKFDKLQSALTRLYKYLADVQGGASQYIKASYWIVIVCDQLKKHCPGPTNMAPCPRALPEVVKNWALEHGYAMPEEQWALPVSPKKTPVPAPMYNPTQFLADIGEEYEEAKVGDKVYLQPDGSYSTVPSAPGQQHMGTVLSKPDGQGSFTMKPNNEWKAAHGIAPKGLGSQLGGHFGQKATGLGQQYTGSQGPSLGSLTSVGNFKGLENLKVQFNDKLGDASSKDSADSLIMALTGLGMQPEDVLKALAKHKAPVPEVKVHGGTDEEKAVYEGKKAYHIKLSEGRGVSLAEGQIRWLSECLTGDKVNPVLLDLVVKAANPRDTIELFNCAGQIQRQLERFANVGNPQVFNQTTKKFLHLWVQYDEVQKLAGKVTYATMPPLEQAALAHVSVQPKPAPPPIERPERHERKKRTIRKIKDD